MDWRSITTILKGDVSGHDFHGNQWVNEAGGFNAKGNKPRGGGKKPKAAVRQPAAPKKQPAPRPAPQKPAAKNPKQRDLNSVLLSLINNHLNAQKQPTSTPADYAPSPKEAKEPPFKPGKGFLPFTNEKIQNNDESLHLGGAQQIKMGKVTFDDGSKGVAKTIGQWNGIPAEEMAKAEVLSSKIGQAIGAPIRDCIGVPGQKDAVIQPWVQGETWATCCGPMAMMRKENFNPGTGDPDGYPPQFRAALGEMRLFDTMTGNGDRHCENVMVTNTNPTAFEPFTKKDGSQTVRLKQGLTIADAITPDSKLVGIDHSLAFRSLFPPSSRELQSVVSQYSIKPSRLNQINKSLKSLISGGTLNQEELPKLKVMQATLEQAFPKIIK